MTSALARAGLATALGLTLLGCNVGDSGETVITPDAGAPVDVVAMDASPATPDVSATPDTAAAPDQAPAPDLAPAPDVSPVDVAPSNPRETCANGLDDDRNGMVDDGCPCTPGAMQFCFAGDPARAGVGTCTWGQQRCVGGEEIGTWGPCTGAGMATAETCDRVDNNCDGRVDEGCGCMPGMRRECYGGPAGTENVGACRPGLQTCATVAGEPTPTWGTCVGHITPGIERCDQIDNNCDGRVDEGCECRVGFVRGCYPGPAGTNNIGACHEGLQTCGEGTDGSSSWGTCRGAVVPARETCDGIDNDCNGRVDEGCTCMPGFTRPCYAGPAGTDGIGRCRRGTQTCTTTSGGTQWSACSGSVTPAPEVCDGMDNDCNGRTDETCLCGPGQTATWRQRMLQRLASRSMISNGDGLPIMPMTCEARRCPDGQVAVQTSAGGPFACVAPPPPCPPGTHANYARGMMWRCDPPCEVIITYGHLYGNRVLCAGRPNITCGAGQAPTFVYETETWLCRPRCNNGQYDLFVFAGMTVCIPC